MSWLDKARKKREARNQQERDRLAQERRDYEARERRKAQEDVARKFYDKQVAQQMEEKAKRRAVEEEAARRAIEELEARVKSRKAAEAELVQGLFQSDQKTQTTQNQNVGESSIFDVAYQQQEENKE